MPSPRAKLAPHFDGRYLTEFLREFDKTAKLAGLTDAEKCEQVLDYCIPRVRNHYKYDDKAESLFEGSDWEAVKKELHTSFGDNDGPVRFSGKELHEFSDECRRRHKIKSLSDF